MGKLIPQLPYHHQIMKNIVINQPKSTSYQNLRRKCAYSPIAIKTGFYIAFGQPVEQKSPFYIFSKVALQYRRTDNHTPPIRLFN